MGIMIFHLWAWVSSSDGRVRRPRREEAQERSLLLKDARFGISWFGAIRTNLRPNAMALPSSCQTNKGVI